jgi:hypothetical protein
MCSKRGLIGWLVLTIPLPAAGQGALLEKLFSKVTDFSAFISYGGFLPTSNALSAGDRFGSSRQIGLYGVGFELSFEVGATYEKRSGAARTDTAHGRANPVNSIDTTTTLSTIAVVRKHGQVDTTFTMSASEQEQEAEPVWRYELALGYSQMIGVRSKQSGVDIYGAIEELPSVSFYATKQPSGIYFGLRTGFAQLHGFRAYTPDTTGGSFVYSAAGTTFEIGLPVIGYVLGSGRYSGFIEGGYVFRKIAGVEWTSPNGKVPDVLPRQLNISGWTVNLGVQVEVGAAGKSE